VAVPVARLAQIRDLFAEDDRLNVYAGELEVRPPGAPTTTAAGASPAESTGPPCELAQLGNFSRRLVVHSINTVILFAR
jgi:hypothetical protein